MPARDRDTVIEDLIGDYYIAVPSSVQTVPRPKESVDDYDLASVQQSAAYADQRLRATRKNSPLTEMGLRIYLDVCLEFLAAKDDEDRSDCAVTIQKIEQSLQDNNFLRLKDVGDARKDAESDAMLAKILHFKVYTYVVRYGPHLTMLCERIGTESKAVSTDFGEDLRDFRYWTETQKALEEEDRLMGEEQNTHLSPVMGLGGSAWARLQTIVAEESRLVEEHKEKGSARPATPVDSAIFLACVKIGLPYEETRGLIKSHSEGEELLHANIQELLVEQPFEESALMMVKDYNDVDKCLPVSQWRSKMMLRKLIEILIDGNCQIPGGKPSPDDGVRTPATEQEKRRQDIKALETSYETVKIRYRPRRDIWTRFDPIEDE